MDPRGFLAIIVVLAIVVIAVLLIARRRQRSNHFKQQFGQEYQRAVLQHGNPAKAEAVLAEREARVNKLSIRELPATKRAAYAEAWAAVQRHFVDDPAMAVSEADLLVNRVLYARGYPMADFDQRAADISVNYPNVVENYRSARDISFRHNRGRASTEDLRQAMIYYRSLFGELLGAPVAVEAAGLRRAS